MHNVLKGIRTLSPSIADRILKALAMSVLDFVTAEDDGAIGGMPRPHGPAPPNASAATRDNSAPRTGPGIKGSDAIGPLPGRSRGPGGQSGPS
jgi:hypothetical protein